MNDKAKAYQETVDQASLERISLRSSAFQLRLDEYRQNEKDAARFIDQEVSEPHFDEESKVLVGTVDCRVWMGKPDQSGRDKEELFAESFFSVEASYAVIFRIPGDHSVETLHAFFIRMAPFSVWPYFRAHVAAIAAEANLRIPIIPIKKLFRPVASAGGYVDPDFVGPETPDD
jgi:hypothetical protein